MRKKKCPICRHKRDSLDHILRLDTSEGVHEITICEPCSNFFETVTEKISERYAESVRLHKHDNTE